MQNEMKLTESNVQNVFFSMAGSHYFVTNLKIFQTLKYLISQKIYDGMELACGKLFVEIKFYS